MWKTGLYTISLLLRRKKDQVALHGAEGIRGHLLKRYTLVQMFLQLRQKHAEIPRQKLALQIADAVGRGMYTARRIVKWELEYLEKGYITASNVGSNTNKVESLFEDEGVQLELRNYLERGGEGNLDFIFLIV